MSDIECAFSGRHPREVELVADAPDDDELGELPIGWYSITVNRREYNPEWVEIQEVKSVHVQAMLAQTPEGADRDAAERFARVTVDATFAARENAVDKYVSREVEVFAASSEDPKIAAKIRELCKILGVPPSTFLAE